MRMWYEHLIKPQTLPGLEGLMGPGDYELDTYQPPGGGLPQQPPQPPKDSSGNGGLVVVPTTQGPVAPPPITGGGMRPGDISVYTGADYTGKPATPAPPPPRPVAPPPPPPPPPISTVLQNQYASELAREIAENAAKRLAYSGPGVPYTPPPAPPPTVVVPTFVPTPTYSSNFPTPYVPPPAPPAPPPPPTPPTPVVPPPTVSVPSYISPPTPPAPTYPPVSLRRVLPGVATGVVAAYAPHATAPQPTSIFRDMYGAATRAMHAMAAPTSGGPLNTIGALLARHKFTDVGIDSSWENTAGSSRAEAQKFKEYKNGNSFVNDAISTLIGLPASGNKSAVANALQKKFGYDIAALYLKNTDSSATAGERYIAARDLYNYLNGMQSVGSLAARGARIPDVASNFSNDTRAAVTGMAYRTAGDYIADRIKSGWSDFWSRLNKAFASYQPTTPATPSSGGGFNPFTAVGNFLSTSAVQRQAQQRQDARTQALKEEVDGYTPDQLRDEIVRQKEALSTTTQYTAPGYVQQLRDQIAYMEQRYGQRVPIDNAESKYDMNTGLLVDTESKYDQVTGLLKPNTYVSEITQRPGSLLIPLFNDTWKFPRFEAEKPLPRVDNQSEIDRLVATNARLNERMARLMGHSTGNSTSNLKEASEIANQVNGNERVLRQLREMNAPRSLKGYMYA